MFELHLWQVALASAAQLNVFPVSWKFGLVATFFFLPFIVFEKWVNTNVVVDTQRWQRERTVMDGRDDQIKNKLQQIVSV